MTNRILELLNAAESPPPVFEHPSITFEKVPLRPKSPDLSANKVPTPYIDPFDTLSSLQHNLTSFQTKFNEDQARKAEAECDLNENELLTLRQTFTAWTGLGLQRFDDETEQWVYFSQTDMINELNEVRAFCKNDLNSIFGLSGVLADINQALFITDLDVYNEEELMAYATLFHIDLSFLIDYQDKLLTDYADFTAKDDYNDEDLENLEELNSVKLVYELKMIILEFKMKLLDSLRLWRWREEVLLGRVGDSLDEYPGVEIFHEFETPSQLLKNGPSFYYIRVGEARRETLVEFFNFIELYHLAGLLSMGVAREVKFGTNMLYDDLADLVLSLIEEQRLDPRSLLTPLGIRIIVNGEYNETHYNLHRLLTVDEEKLTLAASQLGIEIVRDTEVVDESEDLVIHRDQKPIYVLLEELASQTVSAQFYSVIESWREWQSAVDTVVYLEEGEVIFYGVGDGFSQYRVYTPADLAFVFANSGRFQDPYSIKQHPDQRELWTTFSKQSIQRLLLLVLPRLKLKSRTINDVKRLKLQADIEQLEMAIIQVMDINSSLKINDTALEDEWSPQSRQQSIIYDLKQHSSETAVLISQFMAFLFNLGAQLSDWEDSMLRTSETVKDVAIIENNNWKYVDPETTDFLTGRLYKMLTVDVEKYLDFFRLPDKNFSRHITSLRLIRHYQNAFRIDWDDEQSTIGGQFSRMLKYIDLGLYPQLKTSGNWLMATSHYYSVILADQDPTNITIDLAEEVSVEVDLNF